MARLLTDTSIFRRLTAIDLYRIATGTIGDTTTTGATAKGATTVAVTAITNFTAADPAFLIGDGGFELISSIGTPNVTMPITNQKIEFAQGTGARFVEAVKVSLGRLAKDGLQISPARSLTAIEAADKDLPVAYIESALEISASFGLLEFDGLNWQFIAGIVDQQTGAGTQADPHQASLGDAANVLMSNIALRASGLRHDGKNVQVDLLNCRFETSGAVQMNRQQEAILPCTAKFTQMIIRTW